MFGGSTMPLFLLTVYAKNEKGNLTKAEQAAAVTLSKQLLATLEREHERSLRQPDGRPERGTGLRAGREDERGGSPDRGAYRGCCGDPCKHGPSQGAFARSIGVAKGTLLNWEHGRRHPTGPAQVLLAMLAKKPSLVSELLS
jgi:DNA-binding XRE family transcriptional regulator